MNQASPKRRARPTEEGYILVAVIFMMAILILSLSVALPRVRESIQRDREEETMQRGKQYIRAIQLYYKKFNAYPPNVDALIKTNNIRFLRKKYIDPTTGKDEWKAIMYCQNKTPQAMGFFGQPLAGAGCGGASGIGPAGGNAGVNGPSAGLGGVNTTAGGGIFSGSTGNATDPGSGAAGAQTGAGGTDPNGNPISPTGTTGAGTGGTGTAGSSGSAFGSSNNPTGNGQSFGGGGIIGVSPQSPKQSLIVYKKKNHYNEWEFLYSPLMDQQQMGGGNTGQIGQPASGTTTPIGGPGIGGPGTTTPTTPVTPTSPTTTPQQ